MFTDSERMSRRSVILILTIHGWSKFNIFMDVPLILKVKPEARRREEGGGVIFGFDMR